jgi:hypothetical protein
MDCRSFVRFGVLTVLLSTPAIASAQDRQIPSDRLVTITVAEDRPYTIAHSIVVEAGQPVYARTGAELEGRSWTATRTSERGTETIHSDACPALRTIALSFATLPPLQIRPMPSVAHGGEPGAALPMPPTSSTRLAFASETADGSYASVEVAGGNDYSRWGHDAVTALLRCWGPLTPSRAP